MQADRRILVNQFGFITRLAPLTKTGFIAHTGNNLPFSAKLLTPARAPTTPSHHNSHADGCQGPNCALEA
jgi:hypothetical protein